MEKFQKRFVNKVLMFSFRRKYYNLGMDNSYLMKPAGLLKYV